MVHEVFIHTTYLHSHINTPRLHTFTYTCGKRTVDKRSHPKEYPLLNLIYVLVFQSCLCFHFKKWLSKAKLTCIEDVMWPSFSAVTYTRNSLGSTTSTSGKYAMQFSKHYSIVIIYRALWEQNADRKKTDWKMCSLYTCDLNERGHLKSAREGISP